MILVLLYLTETSVSSVEFHSGSDVTWWRVCEKPFSGVDDDRTRSVRPVVHDATAVNVEQLRTHLETHLACHFAHFHRRRPLGTSHKLIWKSTDARVELVLVFAQICRHGNECKHELLGSVITREFRPRYKHNFDSTLTKNDEIHEIG